MIKRILVPVDFSDPSMQALEYAIELIRPHRAEIVVLHAVEPIYYPVTADLYGPGYDIGGVFREMEASGRKHLARLAADLQKRHLSARALLRVGTPAQVIVDAAKKLKADLIVMSTHGRTGLVHALLGSVTEKVVRSAACAVLTVRAKAKRTVANRSRPTKKRTRAAKKPAKRGTRAK